MSANFYSGNISMAESIEFGHFTGLFSAASARIPAAARFWSPKRGKPEGFLEAEDEAGAEVEQL